MIIPHNFFDENQPSTSRQNSNRIYNFPRLSELARNKIKRDDKQLNKDLAKRMLNQYYFTRRESNHYYEIKLDSDHINHFSSKLTILSKIKNHEYSIIYNIIDMNHVNN